jgi:hypothetical protein
MGLLSQQLETTNMALAALITAVETEPGRIDSVAIAFEPILSRIQTSGFTEDEQCVLHDLGFTDSGVDSIRMAAADGFSAGFSEAGFVTAISSVVSANTSTIAALRDDALRMDDIISALLADPLVSNVAPLADAGGPYGATEGVALSLDGSGSSDPDGSIVSWEWDLDADGGFDDATGVAPTATFAQAVSGLVGLRVTDNAGRQSVGYARVTVADVNQRPQLKSYSPLTLIHSILVGTSLDFAVSVSDPNGDGTDSEWLLDGTSIGSGNSLSRAFNQVGVHLLRVDVNDASPQGESTTREWIVLVGTSSCVRHKITATAGPGGSISPPGDVMVLDGGDQTFAISASSCHEIVDVLVDGATVGAVGTYTFTDVTEDHTIAAIFAINAPVFAIDASAGPGGRISPSGGVAVTCGSDQSFTITPDPCYVIADVLVDGVSAGIVGSYFFSEVTAHHSIVASFSLSQSVSIEPVFSTNFESGLPVEMSAPGAVIEGVQGYAGLGPPGRQFGGNFLHYTSVPILPTTLTLRNLPLHDRVDIEFLLAIIDSWDNTELMQIYVDGNRLFNHRFSIAQEDASDYDAPPGGLLSSGTNLGFSNGFYYQRDRAYDLGVEPAFIGIPHTADSLVVLWTLDAVSGPAAGEWQGGDDESWGIDALSVSLVTTGPTITASAGPNGSIDPSGTVVVSCGSSRTYTITPDPQFVISDVVVDETSVGPVESYSFNNVTTRHTISATFETVTAALIALAAADATPGSVRLRWLSSEHTGLTAEIYRRTMADDWSAVGEIRVDGSGQMVFEDTRVIPGKRYGYRLGVVREGHEQFLGETWVDVPREAQLALAGLRPNPAKKDMFVSFSLKDASPARMEVLDLVGRTVATREVGGLGPGSHVVNLAQGQVIPPGIYFLRLVQGGKFVTARAAVVR